MLLLVAAMVMPKMAWAQVTKTKPTNGDGTAANPYQITTAAELAWFRDNVNAGNTTACARLEANIDMSTVCHPANESESVAELSWVPIGNNSKRWHGEFNGNNKTISNLYINASEAYSGFFGYAHNRNEGQRGIIKDIIFEKVNITSTADYSGVLAGYAWNTDISGITVNSGSIKGYEDVGGIVGKTDNTNISNCVNRISIVGSDYYIGGIVGYAGSSSSITNCANYGNVNGNRMVGGIVGGSEGLTLCNVFSSGDVTFSSTANGSGLVVGDVSSTLHISGYVIYNSDAKRCYNTTVLEPVALGKVSSSATVTGESNIKGLSSDLLKSGWGAWLLNGCKSEGAGGQTINTDNYPVLNGTQIYPKDASMKCTYTDFSGTFTNTSSEASTVSLTHGTNTHYEYIAPTCVEGRKEYYECNDCHKKFSDAAMTVEIDNTVIERTNAHHDFGNDYVCKNCNATMPLATLGDADIVVEKTDNYDSQYGYNLFKYIADGTGTLYVKSYGDADTEGAIWTSVGGDVASSAKNDDSSSSETDFSLTFDVTQGETYIIGVRQKSHEAIEGDYVLRLRGSWTETSDRMGIEPFVWTGEGTEASPYKLTSACHLLWFAKLVNNGNTTACARLEADIDMSKVCHAADESKGVEELSWEPISKSSNPWHGSFDGNNKTISKLYINTSAENSGLFGYMLNDNVRCSIKDIIFENVNITSTANYSGVLAGYASKTDISGITVNSGSINGTHYVGGIVGNAAATKISNCVNRIPIVGSNTMIGGIVGYAQSSSSITNCANYGDVKGSVNIGGIVGYIVDITLNNVFTLGNVTCGTTNPNCGLVVGYVNEKLTIQGHVLYNSDAKIYFNNAEQTVQAIGKKYYKATITGESNIVGLNSENLKTGEGAWMLNGQQSTGAWGQTLSGTGKQDYPVLGGLPVYYRDEVYTNTYGILTVGTHTITTSNEPPIWYEFTPEADGTYLFVASISVVLVSEDISGVATGSPCIAKELVAETTYYVCIPGAPTPQADLTIKRIEASDTLLKVGANTAYITSPDALWYAFTPAETGYYQFSSTDIKGSICVNTKKTNNIMQGMMNSPIYRLIANTTYYVCFSYAPGEYDLTIAKLNTTLQLGADNAIMVPVSTSEPIWYEFTPTETGTYQFSSTDIKGSICVNTTKTDDDKQDITTSPTYSLSAGITYYVYVNYISGEYKLTITQLSTTTALEAVVVPQIYAVNGRIVCEGEFRIYDLLGRDVTRLNGSLCGVYVVKTADAAVKVVVR